MKNNAEQADNSVSEISKFDTVEELLSAYNALEKEFTKRCQLVKRLQAALDACGAQTDGNASADGAADGEPVAEAADDRTPDLNGGACAASDRVDCDARAETMSRDEVLRFVSDEIARNVSDYAETLAEIPEIAEAAVTRYKIKLASPCARVAPPRGMAVILPSAKPRTLSEAKRLADRLLSE